MFIDNNLPLEGRDHYKALFIKTEVKEKLTYCMMVDNRSAINVCPLEILPKLRLTIAYLKPFDVVIKAYDDTKRPVNLHVIDIPITFALLLGGFHPLGGVPSTVH